jgi:hypothetical protein
LPGNGRRDIMIRPTRKTLFRDANGYSAEKGVHGGSPGPARFVQQSLPNALCGAAYQAIPCQGLVMRSRNGATGGKRHRTARLSSQNERMHAHYSTKMREHTVVITLTHGYGTGVSRIPISLRGRCGPHHWSFPTARRGATRDAGCLSAPQGCPRARSGGSSYPGPFTGPLAPARVP